MLPETLTRDDAVFNLGRMGLLVAGLADPDALRAERHGRPHPPTGPHRPVPRGAAAPARRSSRPARWPPAGPGAGPSLIGIVRTGAGGAVLAGAEAALAAAGVPGRALVLAADRRGIVYGDEADVPLVGASLAERPGQRA